MSGTLLLLCIVGANLVDWWSFIAEQRGLFGDLVQLVDSSTAVLIPEQEVLIMAQAKGMI